MKTLLVYESKYGCTETCARYLKGKYQFLDMMKASSFHGDLKDYDHIIIGTPVYIGQINKKVKTFISKYMDTLLQKEVDIFICAMNPESYEQMLIMNFDEKLREHVKITHVGGAYDFDKLGWFSKLIVKKIAKVDHSIDDIKYDQLDDL